MSILHGAERIREILNKIAEKPSKRVLRALANLRFTQRLACSRCGAKATLMKNGDSYICTGCISRQPLHVVEHFMAPRRERRHPELAEANNR